MKKFRIIKNKLSIEGAKAFHPLRYKIEQKHCILFGLISWWGTPDFAPPHLFEFMKEAVDIIEENYHNALIHINV